MTTRHVVLGAVAAFLAGCAADQRLPTGFEVRAPLFVAPASAGAADQLGTHLTGAEEVFTGGAPTPASSLAQGEAVFHVRADGDSVDFQLIASNIDNVIMAHIHCGPAGANGPISMWLHPDIGPSGTADQGGLGPHDGVLASGTFSPTDVVCPSGMPLLEAMRAGLTYVNVHTNDGVAPANTGPGDFPGGEIRGQLDHPRGN